MAKTTTKTVGKLRQEAMTLMQKYVRLKQYANDGYCTCCTCGKTGHWREFDGGHYISRQFTGTCLEETNIAPQCRGCNRFMSSRHDQYTLYMIDMYGVEHLEELNRMKIEGKKFTRGELMDIIHELKVKLHEIDWE